MLQRFKNRKAVYITEDSKSTPSQPPTSKPKTIHVQRNMIMYYLTKLQLVKKNTVLIWLEYINSRKQIIGRFVEFIGLKRTKDGSILFIAMSRSKHKGQIRSFRVDRILNMTLTPIRYTPKQEINLDV